MRLLALSLMLLVVAPALAQSPATARGDQMLAKYFEQETSRLERGSLATPASQAQWLGDREKHRSQLLEMLGLDPLPEKTPLKPVVTGTTDHDDIAVENLHFQSRPGLYVTANLYRPKEVTRPLPAVLYVCGHGGVKKDGVSYGNKVYYQQYGAWFARNGYVCLTIDSLQLGEIEAFHHGTHHLDMWWWINRGYVPAGVEAWNCVRALDYLETRKEVDKSKFGVTGRSGGGAYSWYIAAIDERIGCAVPGAGITDLRNHVVDGCVEGHCDCMYFHNSYEWDYANLAGLVAPRSLLVSNTDTDPIFPLSGVVRIFEKVRPLYKLAGVPEKYGLSIGPGGHVDTQDTQVDAFRFLNLHLKGDNTPVTKLTEKFFEPGQLRVFKDGLPADQTNTTIQESFVAAAPEPVVPKSKDDWNKTRDEWMLALKAKTFRSWPDQAASPIAMPIFDVKQDGVRLQAFDFTSQEAIELRLYVAQRADLEKADLVVLNVLDDAGWSEFLATYRGAFAEQFKDEAQVDVNEDEFASTKKMFATFPWAMAYVAPRGVGPTAFNADPKKHTQVLRRFQLLGQTLESGQVYDARRAIATLRSLPAFANTPLWLQAHRRMAGVALYASLFEPDIVRIDLHDLPLSHRHGPFFFNVQRILDTPQAVAMAAERSKVVLYQDKPEGWEFPQSVGKALGWNEKQVQVRVMKK